MQYALNENQGRITPIPGATATCTCCKSPVLAKCGTINVWHWAHENREDCDTWYEPETLWHRNWKEFFPKENQEVVIGNHRADIRTQYGVIELQNSSISAEEIMERERFYGNMIWVVNAESFLHNFKTKYANTDFTYETFRWKHARKCWGYAKCPVYLDVGDAWLFLIKKMHFKNGCGGWGVSYSKEWLLKKYGVKEYED
ncbi:MAG TPA: competence protein CoiA family protein [Stenomitos sp.]